MIKILFFIEVLKEGGAEKVLCNLVNNMDQNQFDITVQTVWLCDASNYLAPGIHYKSMYASPSRTNRIRYRVEAESGLAYRLHIRDDYDIECAYLEMGPTKVMAASTNSKAKKLAWVHCDLSKKVGDIEAFVKKSVGWYSAFDKVICVSENVRESFVELFGEKTDPQVLYNTIDDREIRNKASFPCPERKRKMTALAIGRLTEQKGFDRLLDAHAELLREGFDYDLWILGEGPQRELLERQIREYGMQDSVKLLGFSDNPYPFLRECDFYVCSSRYEGMSTTVIESLILGKPIVTTDCTGMRELLGDSDYGLIVGDRTDALKRGIKTMLKDADKRAEYGRLALERGKDFTVEVLVSQTERFLLRITG